MSAFSILFIDFAILDLIVVRFYLCQAHCLLWPFQFEMWFCAGAFLRNNIFCLITLFLVTVKWTVQQTLPLYKCMLDALIRCALAFNCYKKMNLRKFQDISLWRKRCLSIILSLDWIIWCNRKKKSPFCVFHYFLRFQSDKCCRESLVWISNAWKTCTWRWEH